MQAAPTGFSLTSLSHPLDTKSVSRQIAVPESLDTKALQGGRARLAITDSRALAVVASDAPPCGPFAKFRGQIPKESHSRSISERHVARLGRAALAELNPTENLAIIAALDDYAEARGWLQGGRASVLEEMAARAGEYALPLDLAKHAGEVLDRLQRKHEEAVAGREKHYMPRVRALMELGADSRVCNPSDQEVTAVVNAVIAREIEASRAVHKWPEAYAIDEELREVALQVKASSAMFDTKSSEPPLLERDFVRPESSQSTNPSAEPVVLHTRPKAQAPI